MDSQPVESSGASDTHSQVRQAEGTDRTRNTANDVAKSKAGQSYNPHPPYDLEMQAQQVEDEEETYDAEAIDRPPDEDQGLRQPKVYRPYDLPILLILAPASILGVLCRLGLQALTTFEGSSVFALGYVNALGCLVMGFGLSIKGPLGQ